VKNPTLERRVAEKQSLEKKGRGNIPGTSFKKKPTKARTTKRRNFEISIALIEPFDEARGDLKQKSKQKKSAKKKSSHTPKHRAMTPDHRAKSINCDAVRK